LETQLETAENKIKELVSANSRLTMEVEQLRVCIQIVSFNLNDMLFIKLIH
jgi:regulator of replication initiation timing